MSRASSSRAGLARHLETDEVVAEGEAPDLLADARGRAAAEGLLALEGVGFDFVKADFELPPLVIELDDLRGGMGRGVEQRGEQRVRAEAPPLVANGTGGERLGQFGVRATEIAIDGEIGQEIVGTQALADVPLEIFLGASEPVPLRARGLALVGEAVGQKAPRADGER